MIKGREILAIVAATVAMFIWSMLSYTVLGWHAIDTHVNTDPAVAQQVVDAFGAQEQGIYLSPLSEDMSNQTPLVNALDLIITTKVGGAALAGVSAIKKRETLR